MLYLWVKLIHILSSTILFGTGIGTAATMLYAHFKNDVRVIAAVNRYVVFIDWIFTGSSIILQPITGFWLMWIANLPFNLYWIRASLVAYTIALICWLIVVFLQIKLKNLAVESAQINSPLSLSYYKFFKAWFWLGWPAFFSLLYVFYLMTFKPASFFY